MDMWIDILLDAVLDTLKLLPFLFITYLFMELLEHKAGEATNRMIRKAGKWGPVAGSFLGVIPQCGFSAAAANLYAGRVISVGTLIAIILSTSDEMLPILISNRFAANKILLILGLKILIGMVAGLVIDFIERGHHDDHEHIHEMCESEGCNCDNNIAGSVIKHTLQIAIFIFVINLALGVLFYFCDPESMGNAFWNIPVVGQLLAGLVGLIPNCVASVAITQLYLQGVLSFGAMLSGLLVNSGVALLVLCKVNRHKKDNVKIILVSYGISVLAGCAFMWMK